MARKKVERDLPPLPRRVRFKRDQDKTGQLLKILRSLATKNRRTEPRTFYSVREVAGHFKVPVSSVAKIYREMEREGILSRVRSSRTILNGKRYNRRLTVRAFVGLPAFLPRMLTIRDYRSFYIFMDMALRARGFVPVLTFVLPDQADANLIPAHFKQRKVDAAIWFRPDRHVKNLLLRLVDAGIRLVGVADSGNEPIPCRYQIRKDSAIQELFREWKLGNGVSRVTIVESREHRSLRTEETLNSVLEELSIESEIERYADQSLDTFLRRLCSSNTDGIVFPSAALAAMFCFRNSDGVAELARRRRVAFIDGPVDMPFSKVSDVAVDVVTIDWNLVAESIVDEFVTQRAFESGNRIFEATSRLRLPLSKFAEEIWDSGMRRFNQLGTK